MIFQVQNSDVGNEEENQWIMQITFLACGLPWHKEAVKWVWILCSDVGGLGGGWVMIHAYTCSSREIWGHLSPPWCSENVSRPLLVQNSYLNRCFSKSITDSQQDKESTSHVKQFHVICWPQIWLLSQLPCSGESDHRLKGHQDATSVLSDRYQHFLAVRTYR